MDLEVESFLSDLDDCSRAAVENGGSLSARLWHATDL